MDQADIVIVGAGIVGATLAWNLRDSGLDVTVIDRAEPGSATTTWTFAWMNASSKVRRGYVPEYVELSVNGSRESYQLGLDIPGNWLHATGNLELVPADGAAQLEADVRRLVGLGYAAQFLGYDQLVLHHPELDVDEGTVAAWFPTEGWIDGPALVDDIVHRLAGSNVRFRTGEVVGFDHESSPAGSTGVRLSSGEQIRAGRVVLTAGAWTADLAALAGVTVPMVARTEASVPGLVVRATAPAGGLRHQVLGSGFVVRPHRSGEVLLSGEGHGLELTTGTPAEAVSRGAAALLTLAGKTVPALRGSEVIAAGVGLRPLPDDGVSIVGPGPAVPAVYVAVTHSGVSLAPILGKLIARELLSGRPEEALEPFRLTRFR
ncbi:FAD-binding oxidoreductase [Amycolatopsis sp. GM8]|uniref:NAD(P)/FAD-dependent oxidoreductase n=1 Tax=Amycolatopsis sp. GM8 TaxID=2896530 RepID=UPI001F2F9F37|nr:FAD-binding oxidoreductase [Amycolatopsis sp. GM8]